MGDAVRATCPKSCSGDVLVEPGSDAATCDKCGTTFVFREPMTDATERLLESVRMLEGEGAR